MLAALLGWPQGTFASKVEVAGSDVSVTREVDGGLETVKLSTPAIVTTDLRLNEPRYASLPNIMKAKSKPLATKSPGDFGVDVEPRLETLKVVEPSKRQAGRQGRQRRRAGRETQSAGSCQMKTLVLVEHDGASIKDATLATVTAAAQLGEVHLLVAGSGVDAVAAGGRQDRRRRQGPCRRRRPSRAPAGRGCRAARRGADGRPRRLARAGHHLRQEHRPARRRACST